MAISQTSKRIVKMDGAGQTLSGDKLLRGLVWVGPLAAGDTLLVSDTNTGEIFGSKCSVINQGDSLFFPTTAFAVKDLTVTTMTSGVLYVYLD
jgi:hypothetical protein